jgi:pyochelin synthetase
LRGQSADAVESRLEKLRYDMSHEVLPCDRWPLFNICMARFDPERTRLHLSFDGLILDGWSVFLLMREWAELYRDPSKDLAPLAISFRDYVLAEARQNESAGYHKDREYWIQRAATLPPAPALPVTQSFAALTEPRFVRRTMKIDAKTWARLKARATRAGLTPPGLLLAAYAEVLSLWSRNQHFTINVPRFNRQPFHPQASELIGEFASFTLLEVAQEAGGRFEERARKIQEQLWADLDHSLFSGVRVLRELAQKKQTMAGVTMPVVFTCFPQDRDKDASLATAPGELGNVTYSISQTSHVWLDNHVYEQGGDLVSDWDAVEALFPEGVNQEMLNAYQRLLYELDARESAWGQTPAQLSRHILPKAQVAQIKKGNTVETAIPQLSLGDLLCDQIQQSPDRPAIIADRTLTYAELDRLVTLVAHRLRSTGSGSNQPVALVTKKGWTKIVAALGIFFSAAACLPIDASTSEERFVRLLRHGNAAFGVTDSILNSEFPWPPEIQRLCIDRIESENDATSPKQQPQAEDPVWIGVEETDGSALCSVMATHAAMMNSIHQMNASLKLGPEDRLLALMALESGAALSGVFGLLAVGGTIILPADDRREDAAHWTALARQHRATVLCMDAPSAERLLEELERTPGALPGTLRCIVLSGDPAQSALTEALARQAPQARVIWVASASPAIPWNICYEISAIGPDKRMAAAGRPIGNSKHYILNELLADCPAGVTGELYCSGPGAPQALTGNGQPSSSRFARHPLTAERLYRTGKLGRFLQDGSIEYVAARKLANHQQDQDRRFDLSEIEMALRRHANIRSVEVRPDARGLTAHVALKTPGPGNSSELLEFLQRHLPDYMVPADLVISNAGESAQADSINPLGARGVSPATQTGGTNGCNHPSVEAEVQRLVRGVLKQECMDPDVSLLNYGANSIDMVKIGNQLEKQFGFRPRMDQLFRLQTISAISQFYSQRLAKETNTRAPERNSAENVTGLAGQKSLLDPAEREAFKATQPGIRRDLEARTYVQLEASEDEATLRTRYLERRSHRKFSLKPIPFDSFSRWLSHLSHLTIEKKPKYLYASPGGLYATQTYLHLKAGRVEGLTGGTYYYHPAEHRLVILQSGAELRREVHVPFVNAPIFDEAAFSLFFIAPLSAIAPTYGEQCMHFLTLEAGLMAHLLEMSAPSHGIGICQTGGLDFERIRNLFDLQKDHVFIHSLLGGSPMAQAAPVLGEVSVEDRPANRMGQLLDRIKDLSEEEVKALLRSNQPV